jgi:DNA polymerase-1
MILQIHDELLFEIEQERTGEAAAVIREVMENIWPVDVPIRVDIGTGANWAEAH